ncbi:MAG: insulinase family protein [Firmicutes bacterium]|nr:insulinase family protein [Bacillota bacterium]
MKKKLLFVLCLLQLLLVNPVFAEVEFTPELFTELAGKVNEIPVIETPEYKRIELENGMVVYLAEDHELPVVEVVGYIKGGSSQESQELAGISSVMARMMNTGTKNYSEAALSRYKELNGLSFELSSSLDYFSFSGNALSSDQDKLIGLIAEILRNPEFEGDYYNRIIQEYYQALLQQYYYDFSLLNMFFATTLYGDHPYGYSNNIGLIVAALPRMTPAVLADFYQQTINPANIVMAVSGDFDLDKMAISIMMEFGDWENKGGRPKEIKVTPDEANHNRIILVHKDDATQAKMMLGYNFYASGFEEEVPFLMANLVFGSGDFSSRLMDKLRSERGYVYGIHSGVTYNQQGGLYYITTDVAPEKAYATMNAIKAEMLAIKEGEAKIGEEELFKIVNLYNAFYPKAYTTQISVLKQLMYNQEILGKGEDSINALIREYNSLSAARVQEVFAEHTFPERFLTVIVGRKDHILPAFEEHGLAVEVVELF